MVKHVNVSMVRGLVLVMAGLMCGCATKKNAPRDAIFIPPAPATPRLQFLTSIDSSLGIEKENQMMQFLTGEKKRPKPIFKPYGVAMHQGKIFVCDSVLPAIEIIDLAADQFEYWAPSGPGAFKKPLNIAFDENGNRYVVDVARGEVLIYDAAGNYQGAFGGVDRLKPTGIAVGGGKIYVTNLLKTRVDVHDVASKKLLFSIPRDGSDKASRLFSPTNLALDDENRLYVSDTGGFLIKIFDTEGQLVSGFGEVGTALAQFIRPKGIAVDREKRVYCVDAATEVVKIFNAEHKLLLYFGRADGTALPLVLPAGICINYEHVDLFRSFAAPGFDVEYLVLVINQYGARKLSVYGFGAMKP